MLAALELFADRPFEHITLPEVAARAGVGLQTVVRRVATKDGLARAVQAWVAPQVRAERREPVTDDPDLVAAALARHYERWGALTERTLQQADVSPALAANADAGRRARREWIAAASAGALARRPAVARDELLGRLLAVCGVELWLVLRRDGRLTAEQPRAAVADLVRACLASPTLQPSPER